MINIIHSGAGDEDGNWQSVGNLEHCHTVISNIHSLSIITGIGTSVPVLN
jgi:hypothetical protein